MAKFNQAGVRATGRAVTTTVGETVTHEGAPAYLRDTKSELFSLAVTNMVGENTFYESAEDRDKRYAALVGQAAIEDFEWLTGMLGWLRLGGNLRSASLVGAAEAVKARLKAGLNTGNADLIEKVLQRADEPGEFVAYWLAHHGRPLPKPVLKGVARAVRRLYTEYSFSKWDSGKRGLRFADVLNLVHPEPTDEAQRKLFKFILDDRHHGDATVNADLPLLTARKELTELPVGKRRALLGCPDAAERLRAAGMTWESVGGWIQGEMDREVWTALAPTLPYMALLRNLRGLDEAGIDNKLVRTLADKIADPEKVAKSRQLPFRFLSAYRAAPSDRWKQALTEAADASLGNIEALGGRTLVLVDTSGSMTSVPVSGRSKVTPLQAGGLFGVALASRGEADLYGFAGGGWGVRNDVVFKHEVRKGSSVLAETDRLVGRAGEVGHGTMMREAVAQTFNPKVHKRIVIVSDMQCMDSNGALSHGQGGVPVPDSVPVYAFNLGGYQPTAIDTRVRNRYELGGLTDATFAQIRHLEAGISQAWPWER